MPCKHDWDDCQKGGIFDSEAEALWTRLSRIEPPSCRKATAMEVTTMATKLDAQMPVEDVVVVFVFVVIVVVVVVVAIVVAVFFCFFSVLFSYGLAVVRMLLWDSVDQVEANGEMQPKDEDFLNRKPLQKTAGCCADFFSADRTRTVPVQMKMMIWKLSVPGDGSRWRPRLSWVNSRVTGFWENEARFSRIKSTFCRIGTFLFFASWLATYPK